MRFHPISLLATLLCTISVMAQRVPVQQKDNPFTVYLQNGAFVPQKNIDDISSGQIGGRQLQPAAKTFLLIQFEELPAAGDKETLKAEGIELLDYIPGNAFTATITGPVKQPLLKKLKARAVVELLPVQKMEPSLAKGVFPDWTVKTPGMVEVWISFPRSFSYEEVATALQANQLTITATDYRTHRVIGLRVPQSRLEELAGMPYVEYVQPAPKKDEVINNKSTAYTKANLLKSTIPGGRGLSGKGVVVGVGDDSNPMNHIDLSGRIINRTPAAGGNHGMHVMGTLGGAGVLLEWLEGYAPKATIVAQSFSNILANAQTYVQDYGMVITNNSYGNIVNDCNTFGVYDLYSRVMDQQMIRMPHLQHVFASGNSGNYNCAPYPATFSNVLGGYQTAKNVITVGNITELGVIHISSSKGPVRDGRIKPEIVAQGSNLLSTVPINSYGFNSGTSMSAPAVSGGLALLYERYRQLHANADPANGLMKALLCNGATDKGNAGPDFKYGFGVMNLLRSVTMLEQQNYFNATVNAGGTNTHTLTIPAGSSIAQLKVMLYWNDSAAAALSARALVNDLDLTVSNTTGTVYFPQLLDSSPDNVNTVAVTGADHTNNVEQVVIDNPTAGTYTFTVRGTTMPFSSQYGYHLVFDTLPVASKLTFPTGGERFKFNDSLYVSWDSYGTSTSDFSLYYSTDDGSTWAAINTAIAPEARLQKWFAPAIATNQARLRLVHNASGAESITAAFTILNAPAISLAPVQCEGYITVNWTPVAGATDYEIMQLKGDEMVSVATTAGNTYTISGLSTDSTYWVSVRARLNGSPGQRGLALSRQPNSGTCTGTVSDNDLKVEAIVAPVSGREFTSTALTNSTVRIRIKNLDDAAVTNFTVKYSVNNGPFVSEAATAAVAGGGVYLHDFTTPFDFSAIGTYTIKAVVENTSAADPVTLNDTLTVAVKHLPNTAISLIPGSTAFFDDVEAAADSAYYSQQTGLAGADRYDFSAASSMGRLRTFVNTGIAYSGKRAFTLDAKQFIGTGVADSLKATFNLAAYTTATDDLRFDFQFKNHGQLGHPANKVWIRGNDQSPWIEIYNLYTNQADPGKYKRSKSLELTELLTAAGQDFSSSFQVRWGQWGQFITADNENASGYTIDDIHLYKVVNDIQLLSIDDPMMASCGLTNTTPVKITLRNSSLSPQINIPVKMQIDGGVILTETIPVLAGKQVLSYTFTGTAALSALGSHTVKIWTDHSADSYQLNDTVVLQVYNSPVISSFPYLENFESGNGHWHAAGEKSSWELGTPASIQVKTAASGINAWKTGLTGNYNDGEKSYLYSPCFNTTGMANPTLSFSVAIDVEDCGPSGLCDAVYAEYSADGKTWLKLGAVGDGTNWYNRNYSGNAVWSIQNYTRWHVATVPLPAAGFQNLRIRFVMEADPYVSREGIAVDDIHIYDNANGIYSGPPYNSGVVSNQPAGSNWVNFLKDGKLIASVKANEQQPGNTDIQAYINNGATRNNGIQYYHNRNMTIRPAQPNLGDSVTVRFYFLDTETEALLAGTGCTGCVLPKSAYELGVAKYSGNAAEENGSLTDNLSGTWSFIPPAKTIKVPFDKGYYAEFKTKRFSEFWLSKQSFSNALPPQVQLAVFTAEKTSSQADDVITRWTITSERHMERYEVEVARGNEAYRQNDFSLVGTVYSQGNSTTARVYTFTDLEQNKTAVRYYRLKMIDQDGGITYSAIVPVVFTEELKWDVYPNPSPGLFNLVYQLNTGETMTIRVYDVHGKVVLQRVIPASGFVQKEEVNLLPGKFAAGLYLLEAILPGGKRQVFRLARQ